MFEAIGTIINAGPSPLARRSYGRRTYQPIRRHSHTAGRCEGAFWRPITRKEAGQIVLAAKRYELATRRPGARKGALGGVALEVLEYLGNRVDWRTGRLEPSIDTMRAKLRRSRDAIVRALQALRAHGFLDWLRRYVPTGNETGPRVKQTSNAYRLSLPERARRLLGRYGLAAPLPDDFAQAQADRAAMIEQARASMTELERTMMDVDPEDPIGGALLRLAQARAIRAERESAKRSESLSKFLFMAE